MLNFYNKYPLSQSKATISVAYNSYHKLVIDSKFYVTGS